MIDYIIIALVSVVVIYSAYRFIKHLKTGSGCDCCDGGSCSSGAKCEAEKRLK